MGKRFIIRPFWTCLGGEKHNMQENDRIQKVLRALKANRFHAVLAKDRHEAREVMLDLISQGATVGVGDSGTIRQIGIIPELEKRGTVVVNPGMKR
jgi:L-lactate utilization protein LutB